jgi:hypothetical protein
MKSQKGDRFLHSKTSELGSSITLVLATTYTTSTNVLSEWGKQICYIVYKLTEEEVLNIKNFELDSTHMGQRNLKKSQKEIRIKL